MTTAPANPAPHRHDHGHDADAPYRSVCVVWRDPARGFDTSDRWPPVDARRYAYAMRRRADVSHVITNPHTGR